MARKAIVLAAVALFLCVSAAEAATWTNPASGDWSGDLNWDPVEPVYGTSAFIDNGGTALITLDGEVCSGPYLGTDVGESGTIQMTSGSLDSSGPWIGLGGTGVFNQSGGTHTTGGVVSIGQNTDAVGTYYLSSSGELNANTEIIGRDGTGYFYQSGGTNSTSARLDLAVNIDSFGTYELSDGNLFVGFYAAVGLYGTGTFTQTGGTATITDCLLIGGYSNAAGKGTYSLTGGTLNINKDPYPYQNYVAVGYYGEGVFYFGDADTTGTINEVGDGDSVSLLIAPLNSGKGTFRGWGTVGLTWQLRNNCRVIADGYGTDRTLDLSGFSVVENTIDNTTTNGWFATDGGRLALPPVNVPVRSGTWSYNWGEWNVDTTIDLVHSVRMAFTNVTTGGDMSIALLSPDRADVPPPPDGVVFFAVWDFQPPGGFEFDSVDLVFRYDDDAIAHTKYHEIDLRLFHYDGGVWVDVTDDLDMVNKWITTDGATGFSLYATGVPEPASASMLLLGAVALLRRRRK